MWEIVLHVIESQITEFIVVIPSGASDPEGMFMQNSRFVKRYINWTIWKGAFQTILQMFIARWDYSTREFINLNILDITQKNIPFNLPFNILNISHHEMIWSCCSSQGEHYKCQCVETIFHGYSWPVNCFVLSRLSWKVIGQAVIVADCSCGPKCGTWCEEWCSLNMHCVGQLFIKVLLW